MKQDLQAIVLAAGRSSRFNTKRSKLLEKICGREMILFPVKLLESLKIPMTIVVGFQNKEIEELIKKKSKWKIDFVLQSIQKGTGHAVECTKPNWKSKDILILNGDCPLLTKDIIENLCKKHYQSDAVITFVTAHNFDPSKNSYGKVVTQNNILKIIEAKDADEINKIDECCINAGVYLVKREFLENSIDEIKVSSVTGEFYLTTLIELASKKGLNVEMLDAPFDKIRGVNTFHELWAVEYLQRTELISKMMESGVRFDIPNHVHIDMEVEIGPGTSVGPGVLLKGNTKVGKNCFISAFTILENTIIEDDAILNSHVIIRDSQIKSKAIVGDFAYIHSNSIIGNGAVAGHFVEIKNSSLGSNTKAKHLAYIGDAFVGNNVNIGAGTITANFDGYKKNKTHIKDNAFIGSNTSLISPVTLGKGTFTAAGSVITEDVPDNAFAVARSKQINKENYAKKYHPTSLKLRSTSKKKADENEQFLVKKNNHKRSNPST